MAPRRTADEAAATRDNLIDAALEVFAERGFGAAQLEEIAARAQVTRGAFYHHFSNKAELWMSVMAERWPVAMAPLWRLLEGPGPSRERVRAFVAGFCTALERDPVVRALLAMGMSADSALPELGRMRAKAEAMETWVATMTAAIAVDRKPAAARQAAIAVLVFLNGVVLTSRMTPALVSPARDAARLAAACVDGALGPD
jgi:TetR/AcrR family transcriptional regulator, acrAB operon repressor